MIAALIPGTHNAEPATDVPSHVLLSCDTECHSNDIFPKQNFDCGMSFCQLK